MKNIPIIILALIGVCFACEESVDFEWGNRVPRLVVDGTITSDSLGNYVQLTLSDSIMFRYDYKYIAQYVNDAVVIVSDDMGNTDTLERHYDPYTVWDTVTQSLVVIDSFQGCYDIKNIQGIPGHEYFLTVHYKGKEYHASAHMNEVPQMDTIYFQKRHDEIKGEDFFPILISFPVLEETENNYMFLFGQPDYLIYEYTQTLKERMTLLSGEFLNSYVSGLDVCQGYSPDYWRAGYRLFEPGDSVVIVMLSISPEGFNYYESLAKQIEQYDGVFNPAPTTPEGNISGGALGYFGASAVSRIQGKVPEE